MLVCVLAGCMFDTVAGEEEQSITVDVGIYMD